MFHIYRQMAGVLLLSSIGWAPAFAGFGPEKSAGVVEESSRRGLLWHDPGDIRSLDLFYGSGGREDQPQGPFTFLKEDLEGTNPKFVVRDKNGVTWKVKLGKEAKPETVASRFVWAMGYFVPEEYFLNTLPLQNKPAHLKRGRELMHRDGSFSNARLKRDEKELKKIGIWKWRENSSVSPRELNGLRVMMALMNNWDLKDVNNAVYENKKSGTQQYMVSDLGATFGTPGISWSQGRSKGNLSAYQHSKFITRTTSEYVDFAIPARPALINVLGVHSFFMRLGLRKIGKHVPRDDAHWMGEMLGRLSPKQIRDSFRAGGYSPEQTEAFARVVEQRIALLKQL